MELLGLVEPFQRVGVEIAVDAAGQHQLGPALSDHAGGGLHGGDPARMPARPGEGAADGDPLAQPPAQALREEGGGVRREARTRLAQADGDGDVGERSGIRDGRQGRPGGGGGQGQEPVRQGRVGVERAVAGDLHGHADAVDHVRMLRDRGDAAPDRRGAGRAIEAERRARPDADDDAAIGHHCTHTPLARTEAGVPRRGRRRTVVLTSFSSRPGGTSRAAW